MSIVHVRIDDRLIHGQVAMIWSRHLGATRLMVVDDEATQSDLIKMSLKLATPNNVSLSILSLQKAAERINGNAYQGQRVILILRSPENLLKLLDLGVSILDVNIGNLSHSTYSYKLNDAILMSDENVQSCKRIQALGVKITFQRVPSEAAIELSDAYWQDGVLL